MFAQLPLELVDQLGSLQRLALQDAHRVTRATR
jgi:hypothetical protein